MNFFAFRQNRVRAGCGSGAWRAAAACAAAALMVVVVMVSPQEVRAQAGLATVKDYGAVGDGVANDQPAFQAALNGAKIVHVPAGRYRLAGQVQVPAGGALVGEGTLVIGWDPAGAANAASGAAVLLLGSRTRVEGVQIEKEFTDGSYGTGILADRRSDVAIRNVGITGYSARYGIHLIECTEFQITGCRITDFMMNTTADMIADSPAGIRITRSLRGTIRDCVVERIEVGPVGLQSISPLVPGYGPQGYQSDHMTLMQCRDVAITGNTLLTSGEGIDLLLSESCTVDSNVIADIFAFGIKMLGTSFCTVGENMITDCYQGIVYDDGASNTKCYGNVFHGNMIRDTGSPGSFGIPGPGRVPYNHTAGVFVNGVSDWNIVTENVVLDTQEVKTQTEGVRSNGQVNNRLADNIVSTALTYLSQDPMGDGGNSRVAEWLRY